MIQLKNISKTYQSEKKGKFEAIKSVSLQIAEGDIFGIIGFSGAGKSSLLRMMNLLESPDAGDIFIDGRNIVTLKRKELRQLRQSVSMIFQDFNLFNNKTVFGNVSYPLEIAGVSSKERKERVRECLKIVNLEDKINEFPSRLSGGQKQRVAIARALATNPKVLLCDEPTSALDPQTTEDILAFLKKINQQLNITVVIVTHEMHVVKYLCNKVAVMEDGKVIENFRLLDKSYLPVSDIAKVLFKENRLNA